MYRIILNNSNPVEVHCNKMVDNVIDSNKKLIPSDELGDANYKNEKK